MDINVQISMKDTEANLLSGIFGLLKRLVELGSDRKDLAALTADVKQRTESLSAAIPFEPGPPIPMAGPHITPATPPDIQKEF